MANNNGTQERRANQEQTKKFFKQILLFRIQGFEKLEHRSPLGRLAPSPVAKRPPLGNDAPKRIDPSWGGHAEGVKQRKPTPKTPSGGDAKINGPMTPLWDVGQKCELIHVSSSIRLVFNSKASHFR